MNQRFTNPFATRFTRPGAIEFSMPRGASAEGLVDRLASRDWRGQIVGPHGAGKSTLLQSLLPRIEARGRRPLLCRLGSDERRLPLAWNAAAGWAAETLVVVDGYEQLRRSSRAWIAWSCWRSGAGLLVTTHAPVRLPILIELAPSLVLAQSLARRLQQGHLRLITDEAVTDAFATTGGNVRETLFALYDVYETERRRLDSAVTNGLSPPQLAGSAPQ